MAANRSSLVPTPITDVNGKRTTVYRRAQPKGRAAVPGPALHSPISSAEATARAIGEFPGPKERTVAELKAALRDMQIYSDGPSVGRGAKVLRSREGWLATRLALDLIEDGALSREDALLVLSHGRPESDSPIAADALRVATTVRSRVDATALTMSWHEHLVQSVRGAARSFGWTYRGATSQGEIAKMAAIAEFILRAPRHRGFVASSRGSGAYDKGRIIAYPYLEALLREQPESIDGILDYVSRVEADWQTPEAIHRLRAHLAGTPAALNGGWL